MKLIKLLSAGLVACTLLTLTACSSDSSTTDWDQYKQEEAVIDSVKIGSGDTEGTLSFESIDSDTVTITGYVGPDTPHTVTIPATVQTSTDSSVAPKTVVSISASAFHSFSNIKEVILPEGLVTIEKYAFAECKQLERVSFPSTLESIDEAAFYGCTKLSDIGDLSKTKLSEIARQCFSDCKALTTLTIPASVKTVGTGAFLGCSGLTTLTIAEGVETLGEQCFMNATSLKTLTLPSTLKNTDPTQDLAFYGASQLETVTVPTTAPDTVKAYADAIPTVDAE